MALQREHDSLMQIRRTDEMGNNNPSMFTSCELGQQNGSNTEKQSVTTDENALIETVQNIALGRDTSKCPSNVSTNNASAIHELKKLQEKVGGRAKKVVEIPIVENKLKKKAPKKSRN